MTIPARMKRYQNTTLRMPKHIYERARHAVSRSGESSFNEFVVEAIEEKLERLTEAQIDAAFAQMGNDDEYKRDSLEMARQFERSDWEALNLAGAEPMPDPRTATVGKRRAPQARMEVGRNVRSSKARSG